MFLGDPPDTVAAIARRTQGGVCVSVARRSDMLEYRQLQWRNGDHYWATVKSFVFERQTSESDIWTDKYCRI